MNFEKTTTTDAQEDKVEVDECSAESRNAKEQQPPIIPERPATLSIKKTTNGTENLPMLSPMSPMSKHVRELYLNEKKNNNSF